MVSTGNARADVRGINAARARADEWEQESPRVTALLSALGSISRIDRRRRRLAQACQISCTCRGRVRDGRNLAHLNRHLELAPVSVLSRLVDFISAQSTPRACQPGCLTLPRRW